jgi:hypothetical protein
VKAEGAAPGARRAGGGLPRGLSAAVWMDAAALALGFVALVYLVLSVLVKF